MEELKTTKNEINVEGALLSYELETGKTEKGEDMIRGHIRIKVGEDKDIRIIDKEELDNLEHLNYLNFRSLLKSCIVVTRQ